MKREKERVKRTTGLDGSYWNTVDVNSPRLRRSTFAASVITFSPQPSPLVKKSHAAHHRNSHKAPKKVETSDSLPLPPLIVPLHPRFPQVVVKEENVISETAFPETTTSVSTIKTASVKKEEEDSTLKVQAKEEKTEVINIAVNNNDTVHKTNDGDVINASKVEESNDSDSISNTDDFLFDDATIMSAIDAASTDDNEEAVKYYNSFSLNDDSNFENDYLVINSSILDSSDPTHSNANGSDSQSESQDVLNLTSDDTIPLFGQVDTSTDGVNNNPLNTSNDSVIDESIDSPYNARIHEHGHERKHKRKESSYIGLDGSYWSFTDGKRERTRYVSAYDATLQMENSLKRKKKKILTPHEYEERKRRRLAEQQRLLKHGPRKPSQRSIEEKQRLLQRRLTTIELNALEVVGAEVVPGLYVGSKYAARNLEWIESVGITHVVNCTPSTACNIAPSIVYRNVSIDDSPSEKDRLGLMLNDEIGYLTSVLSNPSNKVLVHCNFGKSRSPTLVICYLIMALGWPFEDAYKKVDDCRKGISINLGFLQLIKSIAKKVHGDKTSGDAIN